MIFIFGDSHANFCTKNLNMPHINLHQNSVTMHRIGRDNIIPNFQSAFNNIESTFIFFYGEVDCRCHIDRQLKLGRQLDEIVDELTSKYITTIKNNIHTFNTIIVCSITPAMRRKECEDVHGPVTHEFPFLGSDEERVHYTKLMNNSLKTKLQNLENFIFFDFTDYYSRPDGSLIYELSDGICHINDNSFIIQNLEKILRK